ncbi:MAG: hypothetical protein WAW13_01305 [Minisyncoccia bacterium]
MHHTNLLVGSLPWARTIIPLENQEASSDISVLEYARMSIAEVRTLIHEASMRPSERAYRVFIISCGSILGEAQNALLKLFEEPNAHTVFYFIIPRVDILLPTLLSRFQILGIEERGVVNGDTTDFFNATYTDRLTLIAKKIEAEDSAWIQTLVESLAAYAHKIKQPELIHDVLFLESYIHAPGSSKKMLLEHIALTLPQSVRT